MGNPIQSNGDFSLPGLGAPLVYLSAHFVRAKEYLEAILASTTDAIWTTDTQGRIIYFSPGAERMLGRSAAEAAGAPVWTFYEGWRGEAGKIMRRLLAQGNLSDHEMVVLGPEKRRIHVSMSASLLKDRHGTIIGMLGISKDISRRVELEGRLRELSITDELTGLFNHRHFHERGAQEVQRARRQDQTLSILLIDIDRFKKANDRWGHKAGDRILRELGDILSSCIRKHVDSAYRYGGDEFVVLLPGLSEFTAKRVARRVQQVFAKKSFSGEIGLSIGASELRGGETLMDLFARADALMYKAKRSPH